MNRYINALKKRSKNLKNRFQDAYQALFRTQEAPLDRYVVSAPSALTALNIFKDEWFSQFPAPLDKEKLGHIPLFQDNRVEWGINQFGGVKGKSVLELGPLEGGHSYMLQKHGASSIVAIEASPRSFLKCLLVKETLHLDKVQFLCGNFVEYLKVTPQKFDVCIASGVLYHMQNPAELIALLSSKCSQIYLWTHYYDSTLCNTPNLKFRFKEKVKKDYMGFTHTEHKYSYGAAKTWSSFIGGPAYTSNWLSREEILACCKHFGFTDIQINFEVKEHPHGPNFAFTATKK